MSSAIEKLLADAAYSMDDFENRLSETLSAYRDYRDQKANGREQEIIFDDDRFWEYVAQIKIDKHDPADILEAWLKEHNPDYFEES